MKSKKAENKSVFAAFIDLSKGFDCINHDFLYYKLLKSNIGGKIYYAIQELYKETLSCVQLSNMRTEWFRTLYGVRQGDN